MSARAVFRKENTQNADVRTHLKANSNQGSTLTPLRTVLGTSQRLFEPSSVTQVMVTAKAKRLLDLDPEPHLVGSGCSPAKGIVKALSNCPFFILVTNTATRQEHFNKPTIPGRLHDCISTIVSTEAPQVLCKDELSLPSVVGTNRTEEESSPSTSRNQKQIDWHKSIVDPDDYSQYKGEHVDKFTTFQSM